MRGGRNEREGQRASCCCSIDDATVQSLPSDLRRTRGLSVCKEITAKVHSIIVRYRPDVTIASFEPSFIFCPVTPVAMAALDSSIERLKCH